MNSSCPVRRPVSRGKALLLACLLPACVGAFACGGKDEKARQEDEDWSWTEDKTPAAELQAETATPAAPVPEREERREIQPAAPAAPQRAEKPAPRPPPPPKEPEPTNRLESPTNRLETRTAEQSWPAPAPSPRTTSVVAHAGSELHLSLDGTLSSETAAVGQAFQATLSHDVADPSGRVVLPAGTRLNGTVSEVQSAKKVKKKSVLALRFDSATLPDGTSVPVSATRRFEGKGYTGKDGAIIGGSAAGGAILGKVLGKDDKDAAAGAILGGAIGTGVVMGKKGEEVVLPAGSPVDVTIATDVRVERPG